MAKKTDTEKKDVYYNYSKMTEEEVDAIILPVIQDCKDRNQKNGKIRWTEPLLALRNSVIFDLMYKRGYSKRKTIDTLRARWQISEQRCYIYINEATEALIATYNDDIETVRNKQLEKLQELYDDCMSHNKQKEALMAMEQINKLKGLYEERQNITINEIKFEFD